jgi:hypothetical protein
VRRPGRRNLRTPLLTALATLLVVGGGVLAVGAGAAEPSTIQAATLEWSFNEELNTGAFDGSCNHLSAGTTDGSPGQYRGVDGDVTIEKRTAAGTYAVISDWSTRCHTAEGVRVTAGGTARLGLRIRLTGGEGTHDPATGETTIQWNGSFTANLYDELVPLWFTDPRLVIDAAGNGTLTATLGGYASSLDNPEVREAIPPVAGIPVARFSGLSVGGRPGFTASPLYLGVPYDSPEAPQVRNTPHWGSWPTQFVDAMVRTGTSAYWYSTGGASDPRKIPAPVTVSFGTLNAPTTSTTATTPPGSSSTTTPGATTSSTTTTSSTVPSPSDTTTTGTPSPVHAPLADGSAAAGASVDGSATGASAGGAGPTSSGSTRRAGRAGSARSDAASSGSPVTASGGSSLAAADAAPSAPSAQAPSSTKAPARRTVRTVDASLRYTALAATYEPSWNPVAPGSVRITYTVENTGDVTVAARRSAEVSTSVGPAPAESRAADMEPLAPGRTRTLTQVVDDVWPGFGTETVVRMEPYVPDDPDLDLSAATITARTSSTVWPWQQLGVLVLLAAAAVAGVWAWRRHRRTAA